jgi:O-antigen/teichoic acid export membrane protein
MKQILTTIFLCVICIYAKSKDGFYVKVNVLQTYYSTIYLSKYYGKQKIKIDKKFDHDGLSLLLEFLEGKK